MRSKEVEKAINDLMFIVVTDIYDNEVSIDKTKVINEYNQSVGTVLDYIKELEAKLEFKQFGDLDSLQFENTYLDKQVIRDKIKELEEDYQKYNANGDDDSFREVAAQQDILIRLLKGE